MSEYTIRFLYTRGQGTKYSAQLDMIRIFQRAFRRADLPIEYSNGFNPHPDIVMGLPLGMGITSDTEFCDVGLNEKVELDVFVTKLNAALPTSIEVKKAEYRNNNKNIMSSISHMISVISYSNIKDIDSVKTSIKETMARPEFVVLKKSKPKNKKKRGREDAPQIKEVDVKHMIHALSVNGDVVFNDRNSDGDSVSGDSVAYDDFEFLNKYIGDEKDGVKVMLFADAGSASNLNPDLFARTLVPEQFFTIHRAKLYVKEKDLIINPMSMMALK